MDGCEAARKDLFHRGRRPRARIRRECNRAQGPHRRWASHPQLRSGCGWKNPIHAAAAPWLLEGRVAQRHRWTVVGEPDPGYLAGVKGALHVCPDEREQLHCGGPGAPHAVGMTHLACELAWQRYGGTVQMAFLDLGDEPF